jgi:hypothetical protein
VLARARCQSAHPADPKEGCFGFEGGLYHLRRGDVLYIHAAAAEGADSAPLGRVLQRVTVRWRVELAMRKRKREPRAAEADEQGGAGGQAEGQAEAVDGLEADGGMRKAARSTHRAKGSGAENCRGDCAAAEACARAGAGGSAGERRSGNREAILATVSGVRDAHGGAFQLSSTGSDTEWSEGFSSDDDARRSSRPPRHLRVLARQAREVHLTGGE